MKLSEFMTEHNLSDAEMATRIGCSEGAVRKWLSGERLPRQDQLVRINEITAGAVTPNDFFLPPSPAVPLSPAHGGATD